MSATGFDYNALAMLVPSLIVVGVGIYLNDRELVAIGAGALGGASMLGNRK